ncbi:hypothetical protein [Streptosporangium sp. NPDC049078]|uniref:hypothetical protein n=1 Tax=Streptosporangium sp. NPDC049078 TaxID=3155767 RepID=UPI00343D859F
MSNRYGPAPAGQGWTDIRLIGDPDDIEAWATLLHHGTDVWEDSESKPVRNQPGIVRRYIRARLNQEAADA